MLLHKAILLILRIVLGMSIIATFASIAGLGIARQAVEGGADLGEEARTTGGQLAAWLRIGGPAVAMVALSATTERWLCRRWGMA
ncbi:hypothetical protein GLS40_14210 [Pseudooceanicola sp. 216_PA32_1]|uniref:Uncharacterized protein n=1 Tax=Pseudooceanicola pacificus TaxID=2676438 RepID=A0A844WFI7_9RHOB|nr:hypothetical protein [Pseudooceanicola pacificus]MWB79190.1 hypothetical protein [Pseudooceanicola pacificus]